MERIAANPHMRRRLDPTPTQAEHGGYPHQVHRHRYGIDTRLAGFWGGTQPFSNWLTLDGLLGALEHFGWRDLKLVDDIDHFYGPVVSLVALRKVAVFQRGDDPLRNGCTSAAYIGRTSSKGWTPICRLRAGLRFRPWSFGGARG